jgi:predicted nucleotidyltransferase
MFDHGRSLDGIVARSSPAGTMSDPGVLDEIVRRLVHVLKPLRIYLFGSRARGDAREDSDYDILVVVSASNLPGFRRDQIAYRALDGLGVSKEVVVLTEEEFDRRTGVKASLPATVLREGILLHVA